MRVGYLKVINMTMRARMVFYARGLINSTTWIGYATTGSSGNPGDFLWGKMIRRLHIAGSLDHPLRSADP